MWIKRHPVTALAVLLVGPAAALAVASPGAAGPDPGEVDCGNTPVLRQAVDLAAGIDAPARTPGEALDTFLAGRHPGLRGQLAAAGSGPGEARYVLTRAGRPAVRAEVVRHGGWAVAEFTACADTLRAAHREAGAGR